MPKFSTGLRNTMLATGSMKTALANGFFDIYAGAAPATADDAVGAATKLCRISLNSTGSGINFDAAAAAGVLAKAPAEVWSGVNLATGTATWFRHVGAADDGLASTTQPRVQGTIATAGADYNVSNTGLTSGATQTIDGYSIALPTL